jgi:uncharacterized protein YjbI with pentapeptide repeats
MANDEHVAILKKGVDAWNAWRDQNGEVLVNLNDANLSRADLHGANLCDARFLSATLMR